VEPSKDSTRCESEVNDGQLLVNAETVHVGTGTNFSGFPTKQELHRQPRNPPKLYRIEQHESLTASNIWRSTA
jgi:hypothetical protein